MIIFCGTAIIALIFGLLCKTYPIENAVIKDLPLPHGLFKEKLQNLNPDACFKRKENPMTKLHELVLKIKKSIILIMYALLILEIHGVIIINRPAIMSDDFDMAALLSM